MKEEKVVKEEVAETPVAAESTPTEEVAETTTVEEPTEKPAEISEETPADESVEPEKKVSETVPYDRFKEQNQELKELKEKNAYLEAMKQEKPEAQAPTDVPKLDEQSELAVEHLLRKRIEQEKNVDFERKNKEALSDRLVKAAYNAVIQEKVAKKVPYIDRDETLKEAQELADSRTNKQVNKAKEDGIEEGHKLAEQKQQSVAVGEPGKVPQTPEKELSPADYAKIHDIPRAD